MNPNDQHEPNVIRPVQQAQSLPNRETPRVNSDAIYPEATKTRKYSPEMNNQDSEQKAGLFADMPPVGVIIISILIILQSVVGIIASLGKPLGFIGFLIYSFQLSLGLGLLTLKEIARLIYVVLGFISLGLTIPALLFASHKGLLSWAAIATQVIVLVYLMRRKVKAQFV